MDSKQKGEKTPTKKIIILIAFILALLGAVSALLGATAVERPSEYELLLSELAVIEPELKESKQQEAFWIEKTEMLRMQREGVTNAINNWINEGL